MKEAFKQTADIMDKTGFPVLLVVIGILFLLETRFELRKRVQRRWQRIRINVLTGIPAFVMLRFLFLPAMIWLTTKNETWHFGLTHQLPSLHWLRFGIGFLLLDYSLYLWHRLTHVIPFLWRFHVVHHTDPDLDISSSIRFHFGELFLSAIFRAAFALAIGVSPALVLVYEIIFEVATNFHHSNWQIPLPLEKLLNIIVVTPRMHGIHHSIIKDQRNSNWGTIFSFWDRLHKTHSVNQWKQPTVGEAEYQDKTKLTAWQLILMPFRKMK